MELVLSVVFLMTIVHIVQSLIAMSIMFFVFGNPILMENFWLVAAIIMLTGYQGMFAGMSNSTLYITESTFFLHTDKREIG